MANWYSIYTKRGHEDIVRERLGALPGIEIFSPKLKRKKYVRAMLKEVVEDLFPSYIFSRFELHQYFHLIKYTRGVRRFVGDASGMPFTVDEAIIEAIRSRMHKGFVQMESDCLDKGEKVVILDGPLSGFSGIFLNEIKPKQRVLILLSSLQYQMKVELGRELIARAK